MKSLILSLTAGLITLTSVAALAAPERQPAQFVDMVRPYAVIKAPLDQKGNLALLNMFTSSSIYALTMNQVLNGSGTDLKVGTSLKSENLLQQMFRTLSLFDLYFGYSLTHYSDKNGPLNGELALSVVPFRTDFAGSLPDYKAQVLPAIIPSWSRIGEPIVGQFAKTEPTDEAGYKRYVDLTRKNLVWMLDSRFPMMTAADNSNEADKSAYILRSFQPLYWSNWLKADGGNATFFSTMILPPVGSFDKDKRTITALDQPMENVTDSATIERVTYGNTTNPDHNVIRLQMSKDFKTQDKVKMSLEFGRLGNNPTNIAGLKEDSRKGEDLRHEDALIAHGYVHFKKQDPKSFLNELMKVVKIEIGIHKLSFDLTRSNKLSNQAPGTPASLILDAPPFSIKDGLRVNNDESVITFTVSVDHGARWTPEGDAKTWKEKLRSGSIATARLGLVSMFCASMSTPKDLCPPLVFKSYKTFRAQFIDQFVAKKVAEQVGASVDSNVVTAADSMDAAVAQATSQLLEVYRKGQQNGAASAVLALVK